VAFYLQSPDHGLWNVATAAQHFRYDKPSFGPLPSNVDVSQPSLLFIVSKDAQGQKSKYLGLKMNKFFCSLTENAMFTILDNTSPPFITSLNGRKTNLTFAL
jgi:hypothetical protein